MNVCHAMEAKKRERKKERNAVPDECVFKVSFALSALAAGETKKIVPNCSL